jgi:hypothetical protein
MTRIGATCLITIGVWCVIELAVQFGYYRHQCHTGEGAQHTLFPSARLQCLPDCQGSWTGLGGAHHLDARAGSICI